MWTEVTLGEWTNGFPGYWKWVVQALLLIAALLVALSPFFLMKLGARLDRAMCKPGKVTTGFGRMTALVALVAAIWRGIPAAYALWNKHWELHGEWHDTDHWIIGLDMSEKIRYAFPWGEGTIPVDVATILDALKIWWYVPLAGMALVWLMRSWKFKSAGHAALDAAVQTCIALAVYWGYGLFLGGYLLQFFARLGAWVAVMVGLTFATLFAAKEWWNEVTGKNRSPTPGPGYSPFSSSGGGDSGSDSSSGPSGYGVENRDMFNEGLTHRNDWGPDEHWRLVEKSIYGDVYENEKGERKTVSKTDAFGHPTELE